MLYLDTEIIFSEQYQQPLASPKHTALHADHTAVSINCYSEQHARYKKGVDVPKAQLLLHM